MGARQMMKTTFTQTETVFGYETTMTHNLDTSNDVEQQTTVRHRMVFERSDGTAEVSVALTARTSGDRTTADAELNATWNNQPFATRQWRIAAERWCSLTGCQKTEFSEQGRGMNPANAEKGPVGTLKSRTII